MWPRALLRVSATLTGRSFPVRVTCRPLSSLPSHKVLDMPALSPTMTQGNIAAWSIKEGDSVSAGDRLAEIETDKATVDFECLDDGVVAKILVPEGAQDIPVGKPVIVMVEDAADVAAFKDFQAPDSGASAPPPPVADAPVAPAPAASSPSPPPPVPAAPSASPAGPVPVRCVPCSCATAFPTLTLLADARAGENLVQTTCSALSRERSTGTSGGAGLEADARRGQLAMGSPRARPPGGLGAPWASTRTADLGQCGSSNHVCSGMRPRRVVPL